MKVLVKLDARSPFHGVCSVRGLWSRFLDGRRILLTFKTRMALPGYRGDLADAYDKLLVLYDSDLAHLQTVVALLGSDLAKRVCAVPDASQVWDKLFIHEKSEKEGFEEARRIPVQGNEERRAVFDDD